MKIFLLSLMALSAVSMTAFADENVRTDAADEPSQEQLMPADELAAELGLPPVDELDVGADEIDTLLYPRPRPRPRPPFPRPRPRPPYPRYYECGSRDLYGRSYWGRGRDPRWVQYDVHRHCVRMSDGPCRDLGCHPY